MRGLLSPDEEALLKHYRSLSIPVRAAIALVTATAAGVVEEQAEKRSLQIAVEAPAKHRGRRKQKEGQGLFD